MQKSTLTLSLLLRERDSDPISTEGLLPWSLRFPDDRPGIGIHAATYRGISQAGEAVLPKAYRRSGQGILLAVPLGATGGLALCFVGELVR